MTRFVATTLDLSRLGRPDLVRDVSYEDILAATKANFVQKMIDAGIAYDVSMLETDPMIVLLEEYTYREALDLAAINDAGRARMLAFARHNDLEHIAAFFGVDRLAGEADDRFRRRVQLAPDAYGTAGSEGGYVYWAMTSDVRIEDAVALSHASLNVVPGKVAVVILAPDNVIDQCLANVRAVIFRKDIKPLTDIVSLRRARNKSYAIEAVIEIPPGPDPAVVRSEALARLAVYQAATHRIGAMVALSGLDAALHVPAAIRVRRQSPLADIVPPGPDEIAVCTAIKLTIEVPNVA